MKYDSRVRKFKTQKKILNVENLYLYELGMFIFKTNNNLFTVSFNYYLKIKKCLNYYTKSSEIIFFILRFNSKIGHKLLFYQCSKLWTKLPLYLKNKSQYEEFID